MEQKGNIENLMLILVLGLIGSTLIINFSLISAASDPVGPDGLSIISNETKNSSTTGTKVNISGGRIARFNINASIQNIRWKGFVGNVSGSFTLDDASGATIYDWALTTLTGRIYATRNATSVTWSSINCSNSTHLSAEDIAMNHSNADDNISVTFNGTEWNATIGYGAHSAFYVGSSYIPANKCPNTNTYTSNSSDLTQWHEVALYDNTNIVYAGILQDSGTGYDSSPDYNFQLIVPENGLASFTGATAYYIYIELGT